MKVADWIIELVEEVSKKNNIETPIIEARRIERSYSGLQTTEGDRKKIIIRYSKNSPKWEKKLIVLHELAHCMMPMMERHSDNFWEKAFELYKEYKLPIRKVMQNERYYRSNSENGYRKVQGLKPKKIKRNKIRIDSISRLERTTRWGDRIIGIKDTLFKGTWVVTRVEDKRWWGYKITKSLYKKLAEKKVYPLITSTPSLK